MQYRDPRQLLSIDHLDVFLQTLYFDVIGGGRSRDAGLIIALYRKHILCRTGGQEPPDLNNAKHHVQKLCVEDYEREALTLYQSMLEHGFRQDRAIAIADDLRLMNGAHRLASALSQGLLSVPVERSVSGGVWGAEWFRRHLSRTDYLFLLEEYSLFRSESAPVLLWGITKEYWPAVIAGLQYRGLRAEFA